MDDSDPLAAPHRSPTADRPLLGMTVLVVEDSRFASEALRLLCLRSGARIRRADSLRSAHRHLQVYRPTAVVVDLGLPDGSGADLIRTLARTVPRVSVLLGTSGDATGEAEAMAAGADGFLAKPVTSLPWFQSQILSRLPPDRQPPGPREIAEEEIAPDPIALHDDLAMVVDRLDDPDSADIAYIAQFVGGVALSARDSVLAAAANDLARARGGSVARATRHMTGLISQRLSERRVI
ncbi:MAG: response regulator [Pseudooceanicola sp.]|nr:response regulator [Pseudooceanicola sp.]